MPGCWQNNKHNSNAPNTCSGQTGDCYSSHNKFLIVWPSSVPVAAFVYTSYTEPLTLKRQQQVMSSKLIITTVIATISTQVECRYRSDVYIVMLFATSCVFPWHSYSALYSAHFPAVSIFGQIALTSCLYLRCFSEPNITVDTVFYLFYVINREFFNLQR